MTTTILLTIPAYCISVLVCLMFSEEYRQAPWGALIWPVYILCSIVRLFGFALTAYIAAAIILYAAGMAGCLVIGRLVGTPWEDTVRYGAMSNWLTIAVVVTLIIRLCLDIFAKYLSYRLSLSAMNSSVVCELLQLHAPLYAYRSEVHNIKIGE